LEKLERKINSDPEHTNFDLQHTSEAN